MIKMCVFDVDGTLYDNVSHRILDSTVLALKKLQENGIKIVVATGRAHYGLGAALNNCNFDYILAVNGGVIVDKDQNVLHREDFTREDVDFVNEFSKKNDAGLIWKFIDHMYIYQNPDKVDWFEGQINSDIGPEPFIYCYSQDHHLVDVPQSCSIHVKPSLIEPAFETCSHISIAKYSRDGYDVVIKGMNKAVGIKKLMEITGIHEDEIIVFGDNHNDKCMFECVSQRVAMGNAIDEIKEMATYVTTDCGDDGIYNACKHLKLI